MGARHGSKRLMVVASVVAFAFLAMSASAMAAVNIEPLSTAFTGKTEGLVVFATETGGHTGSCEKATLSGKTNATKTNFVNATPAFPKCKGFIGGGLETSMTVANSCTTEGTIPWTLTFNEGGKLTITLNCSLVLQIAGKLCTITVPAQSVENEATWSTTVKSLSLGFPSSFRFASVTYSSECRSLIGVNNKVLYMKQGILIEGIHA